MMNRQTAILCLGVAIVMSGCLGGGGEIPEEDLLGEQEYEWDAQEEGVYNLTISSNAYKSVLTLENRSELRINREQAFRGDASVQIEALKFRFRNGTVVNATHPGLSAVEGSDATTISLPALNGTVGYTASRANKRISTPVFVDGDHRLDLPEGTRVGLPFLAQTAPNPDRTPIEDGQMSIIWSDLEQGDTIAVRYYLVRDLYLFGGLFVIGLTAAVGGAAYYLRQIRRLERRREEVGLDVEQEDDDIGRDGPPPGMP